jgi:hypothetical protein
MTKLMIDEFRLKFVQCSRKIEQTDWLECLWNIEAHQVCSAVFLRWVAKDVLPRPRNVMEPTACGRLIECLPSPMYYVKCGLNQQLAPPVGTDIHHCMCRLLRQDRVVIARAQCSRRMSLWVVSWSRNQGSRIRFDSIHSPLALNRLSSSCILIESETRCSSASWLRLMETIFGVQRRD